MRTRSALQLPEPESTRGLRAIWYYGTGHDASDQHGWRTGDSGSLTDAGTLLMMTGLWNWRTEGSTGRPCWLLHSLSTPGDTPSDDSQITFGINLETVGVGRLRSCAVSPRNDTCVVIDGTFERGTRRSRSYPHILCKGRGT